MDGNVWIWTTNPEQALDVSGDMVMRLNNVSWGRVWIWTWNPQSELHVSGQVTASSPTQNNHLATKIYVDNLFAWATPGSPTPWDNLWNHLATTELQLNGENISMSGGLIYGLADPTGPLQATNKQYVDTLVTSIITAWWGDNLWNHTATQGLDMWNFRISNLNDPVLPTQGVNKRYVDTAIAWISTVWWGWKFINGTPDVSEAVYMWGNVWIWTTNPRTALEVAGHVLANDTWDSNFVQLWADNAIIAWRNGSLDSLRFGFADGVWAQNFRTRMNLTDEGDLWIWVWAPSTRLDVSGKITMRNQTVETDPDNIVATKGYVDANSVEWRYEDYVEKVTNLWEDRKVITPYTTSTSDSCHGDEVTQYTCLSDEIRACRDNYRLQTGTRTERYNRDQERQVPVYTNYSNLVFCTRATYLVKEDFPDNGDVREKSGTIEIIWRDYSWLKESCNVRVRFNWNPSCNQTARFKLWSQWSDWECLSNVRWALASWSICQGIKWITDVDVWNRSGNTAPVDIEYYGF